MYAAVLIPGNGERYSVIYMVRETGSRPFGAHEARIIDLVHRMIGSAVGGTLASFADPAPSELAPRARAVLAHVLAGGGDKQIAERLGIHQYTVNRYLKAIYRHVRVRSRAELLARWVRRGWPSGAPWNGTAGQ